MKTYIFLSGLLLSLLSVSCTHKAPMAPVEDPYEDSIKAEKAKKEKYNGWEVNSYTDEFGNPTGQKYVSKILEGSFSNSATTNSPLSVKVFVDSFNVRFKFYEYGRYLKKDERFIWFNYKKTNGDIDKILLRNETNGYIGVLHAWDTSDSRTQENRKQLYDLILNNNIIKFNCNDADGYGEEYKFELDNTGLKEIMTANNIPF